MKYWIGTLFVIILIFLSYFLFQKNELISWDDLEYSTAIIETPAKQDFLVKIADTQDKRTQGLSLVAKLPKDQGLLFVFNDSGYYGFWMKDMQFPLDLLWVDSNGYVVHSELNISPETYPNTFINSTPAKYVLEVNNGIADELGLKVGERLKILE